MSHSGSHHSGCCKFETTLIYRTRPYLKSGGQGGREEGREGEEEEKREALEEEWQEEAEEGREEGEEEERKRRGGREKGRRGKKGGEAVIGSSATHIAKALGGLKIVSAQIQPLALCHVRGKGASQGISFAIRHGHLTFGDSETDPEKERGWREPPPSLWQPRLLATQRQSLTSGPSPPPGGVRIPEEPAQCAHARVWLPAHRSDKCRARGWQLQGRWRSGVTAVVRGSLLSPVAT